MLVQEFANVNVSSLTFCLHRLQKDISSCALKKLVILYRSPISSGLFKTHSA